MTFIIGMVVVFGCVVTGYLMHHGIMAVLWQPNEIVIICGAALGAFIISNNADVMKDVGKNLGKLLKGKPYNKAKYLDLLLFQFSVFKLIKTKGMLEVEPHIEDPHHSTLFAKFPSVAHNHHAMTFFCDYLRLISMGVDNHYVLEDLMEKELEIHHHEHATVATAISNIADGMPALGIVAAVLGVITTMGHISEPPEVLGGLIGAALVGTFLGVLLSYGVIAPIAAFISKFGEAEGKYMECMKVGLIANVRGNAPVVTVEFVRKMIGSHEQPSFKELEAAISKLGDAGA